MSDSSAQVSWEGDLRSGIGRAEFDSGALPAVAMTWASRTQAPDGKTSPEELLAAAHAACYAMGFSNLLSKEGHIPGRLEARSTVTFDVGEGGARITKSALEVTGEVAGLDAAAFEEAARRAEQSCPVSNAIRGNVEITLAARLKA